MTKEAVDAVLKPCPRHPLITRDHYHVNTLGHIADRRCSCKLNAPPHRFVCAVCVDTRVGSPDQLNPLDKSLCLDGSMWLLSNDIAKQIYEKGTYLRSVKHNAIVAIGTMARIIEDGLRAAQPSTTGSFERERQSPGLDTTAATIEWPKKVHELGTSERSVVPQLNAGEMLARLDSLGFGNQEPRRGNTLWAMVMDAADEIERLRARVAELQAENKRLAEDTDPDPDGEHYDRSDWL